MNTQISCQWKKDMHFESKVNNHTIMLDAEENVGGNDLGPRPKPLLLVALAGCTAMDVISILKKMRIEPAYFNINVDGQLTEEHPKYYKKIHLIYEFKGENLDVEKIDKAIVLSRDKYCGVYAMLSKAAEITYEIKIL